jgi:hypothetical protein
MQNGSDSFSYGGEGRGEMPDPKPIFETFLSRALRLDIVNYPSMVKAFPPLQILERIEDDPERRARVYSACTEMAKKFAVKLDFERQAGDIEMAIDTDDDVAERFVLAMGVSFFVEHLPLEKIYTFVMESDWVHDSTTPANRELAADMCEVLVEQQAWYGSRARTCERILDAITLEELFGDAMPSELRVRILSYMRQEAKLPGLHYFGEVFFNPNGGVSFRELAKHLDVRVMAEPFALYANAINIVTVAPGDPETAIVIEEGGEVAPDEVMLVDDEEVEEDFTREVSVEVAEAMAALEEETAKPPPLPTE